MRSFLLPTGLSSRFAVAVSKKVAPTAVLRNKIKRLVYKAIEITDTQTLADQSGQMVIFGVKNDVTKVSFPEIGEEIKNLLLKIGQK
jgi:ribonuclease P protein component